MATDGCDLFEFALVLEGPDRLDAVGMPYVSSIGAATVFFRSSSSSELLSCRSSLSFVGLKETDLDACWI